MPHSRSRGSRARKIRAAAGASPRAEWRSVDLDLQPRGKALERVAGEVRRSDLGEQPGVERARARPWQACTLAFALEDGEVEADRVADQHAIAEARRKLAPKPRQSPGASTGRGIDAVDAGRTRGIATSGRTRRR